MAALKITKPYIPRTLHPKLLNPSYKNPHLRGQQQASRGCREPGTPQLKSCGGPPAWVGFGGLGFGVWGLGFRV